MPIKKNYQCLMLNANNKKLFTHKNNFPELIELSKTFGVEVSIVKVKEAEILDFNEIASKLCEASPQTEVPVYKTIQIKIPKSGRPKKLEGRAKTMDEAGRIRSYVELDFLAGNEVSLTKLKEKFKKYDLTDSTFCNHISYVKNNLAKQGYKISKVSVGKYICSQLT